MATHPHCLLAYDADGNVIATLDHMVALNERGEAIGLIDFAAHELAGGEHTDIWVVGGGAPLPGRAPGGVTVSAADASAPVTVHPAPAGSPPLAFIPGTEWSARGSKVWPEWLGLRAHEFRVELEGEPGRKRIAALVHRESGHRRERAAVEAAIAAVPVVDGARDIRHLVGGPDRPLILDEHGRTVAREQLPRPGTPAHLPLIGRATS